MDQDKKIKLVFMFFIIETLAIGVLPLIGIFEKLSTGMDNRVVIYALFGVSIAEMLVVHFLRKIINETQIEKVRQEAKPGWEKEVAAREFNLFIITWAIASASAVYAIVSSFLGGNKADFYMLWGFAILSLIYYAPIKKIN